MPSRRRFCRDVLLGASALTWTACGRNIASQDGLWPDVVMTEPAFSRERFQRTLEELRLELERGQPVTRHLRPGADADAIRQRCAWFPAPLPDELVALYGWHDGQEPEAERTDDAFVFRDCAFLSTARARQEHAAMVPAYAQAASLLGVDLTQCFPIAAFEGAWLVVPCGPPPAGPAQLRPVVSVFEGIEVHYYSVERMVATCLAWRRHPDFGPRGVPRPVELDIWRQHNPRIFPGAR